MSAASTRSSPRTTAEPMAFTRAEFVRGAIAAWVLFLLLHQFVLLFRVSYFGFLALYWTFPWSVAMLLLGSPVAYALGRALRRQARVVWHFLAFTVLGLVVGAAGTAGAIWIPVWNVDAQRLGDDGSLAVLVAVSAAPAVALGWWFTAGRALALDRGAVTRRRRLDVDAEYEDSV